MKVDADGWDARVQSEITREFRLQCDLFGGFFFKLVLHSKTFIMFKMDAIHTIFFSSDSERNSILNTPE
jgi:hypothetical protein